MYSIIIVDDEPAIRNGLKKIIDWEDLGIEIAGTAATGVEALSLVRKIKPTIVLTDIRMPEMDGLQLMEEITRRSPDTKIAVLSGYDDFDYLRTAIRLGATNYLLKPVDKNELITTMREIINDLNSNVQEFLKHRQYIQLLQRNTLNRLLDGGLSRKELREKCNLLNISFRSSQMNVALIQLNSSEDEEWKLFGALNICDEVVNLPEHCYIFPDTKGNVVLLFKDRDLRLIKLYMEDCIRKIGAYMDTSCVASVGPLAASTRDIPHSYQTAQQLLNYQLIHGSNQVFISNDIDKDADSSHPLQSLSADMMGFIGSCNREGLQEYIHQIFEPSSRLQYAIDPNNIKYEIIHMISYVINASENLRISTYYLKNVREKIYGELQKTTTADKLQKLLIDFSVGIINEIESLHKEQYSPPVKQVLDYIHQKYFDCNISLKTFGDMLHVSPAYLGRIFKKETGEFFSDYLNNYRIAKATDLLQTTTLRANAIAVDVGFSSTSYFYTAFKKVTGKKPSEIRETGTER